MSLLDLSVQILLSFLDGFPHFYSTVQGIHYTTQQSFYNFLISPLHQLLQTQAIIFLKLTTK